MRASFVLENLLKNASFLNSAISQKTQLPQLAGFLIEADKGKVSFSATDLEVGVTARVPAAVEEGGKTAVLAKPLIELLSTLSEEKITIARESGALEILSRKTKAKIPTVDEGEFPRLFEEKGEEIFSVAREKLKKDLGRVVFAAALDATRPAFSAVLLRPEKDGALMVATDSHRLSLNKSFFLKKNAKLKGPLLVPAKTIKAAFSSGDEGNVALLVSEKNNQVFFSQENTILVGRLIEGDYPDFEKIIPADSATKTELNRQELQAALKTASIFGRDNANIVKMSIKKNSMTISAKSQSLGENATEVLAKTEGEENEIAFNARYILDFLQNVDEETVIFEMTGPLNPGVFKTKEDANFLHLIMPIRIKDEELQ